ncbi:hypothetical protein HY968_02200 [Candidatus Kaiserbacteria bacterium]|nr:hypothetical protein [Candidatus Kaiserbacteria bacterium]
MQQEPNTGESGTLEILFQEVNALSDRCEPNMDMFVQQEMKAEYVRIREATADVDKTLDKAAMSPEKARVLRVQHKLRTIAGALNLPETEWPVSN